VSFLQLMTWSNSDLRVDKEYRNIILEYFHIFIPWKTIHTVPESPVIVGVSLIDKRKEDVRTSLGQSNTFPALK